MSPGDATADRVVLALRRLLDEGQVLILTGAGVSTDSGIPDYRGADGTTRHRAPMTFQEFTASDDARRHYWARSHRAWTTFADTTPNIAHHAVTALQRAGLLTGVVTQNVDNLHTEAGTSGVIALHGRLGTVVCLDCGDRRSRQEMAARLDAANPVAVGMARPSLERRADGDVVLTPAETAAFTIVDCDVCGGRLKPDVVFFGETVPRDRFRRALGLLDTSRTLVVLGSSLAVGSGYRFVTAARRRGIEVAIVTRGVTRGDHHATIRLDGQLADILPAVLPRSVLHDLEKAHRADQQHR